MSMWNFRPPVQGGSNELISKFLLSMILYNHPSYFKSGEINSCRLSPLPTRSVIVSSVHLYLWSFTTMLIVFGKNMCECSNILMFTESGIQSSKLTTFSEYFCSQAYHPSFLAASSRPSRIYSRGSVKNQADMSSVITRVYPDNIRTIPHLYTSAR